MGPQGNRRPFSTSGLCLTGAVALIGAALLLEGCSRTVPRLGSPAASATGSPARSGATATGTAVTPTLAPPTLRNLDYRGIDPDTPGALNELQTAWEHGHQPWRASAPEVAKRTS